MQIVDLVLDGLDFILDHWHALGEVVMLPHLARQFVDFVIVQRLLLLQLAFDLLAVLRTGDNHTQQRQPAGDACSNNCRPLRYI